MAKLRLTQVEILDRKYPGLQVFVDQCFDSGIPGADVGRRVRLKYGVNIPTPTIYSYREKRWALRRRETEAWCREMEAYLELEKRYPEGDMRRAAIFKHLREMTPTQLHRRDVDVKRLQAENEKLAVANKRVENEKKALCSKLQQAEKSRRREHRAIGKAVSDAKADAAEIRRKIDEIYGLNVPSPGDATGEAQAADPAAVSGGVGE